MTLRSIVWLVALSVGFCILSLFFSHYTWLIPWVQIGVATLLCATTFRTLRATAARPTEGRFADRDLPSVTIAIPARNETKDLEECLRTVLASDYPKLEVIVLDDCSQLPTADVVKGFAQQGVRFIPGKPPAKRWLAKNQAYQKLYNEASGDIILFCGVDIRFGVSAVRETVYQMLERHKRMVSVLPVRQHASLQDSYIQPIRYWWELVLPRKFFNRPAVLSTCWAIYHEDIHALGSFKATSRSVMPEQYFARELVRKDAYSFLRSSASLDVATVKSLEEQRRTALR
ncbi:glycosyltransferase family 2 protein, partial [Candidatus Saccharibacteria bacterium]|nr:glycosyltransferase family 2 protein [Candidatus Saccharibacteria bacterium]